MAIIRIWFLYDKNPYSLHITTSYKTVYLFIDSNLKAVIRTKVHLG